MPTGLNVHGLIYFQEEPAGVGTASTLQRSNSVLEHGDGVAVFWAGSARRLQTTRRSLPEGAVRLLPASQHAYHTWGLNRCLLNDRYRQLKPMF